MPDDALPKDQRWVVSFLNDTVRKEFTALNADLRAAFWDLHDDVKFYGIQRLTKKQAKRLAGTKDLWELRFKRNNGIGRGLYVQMPQRRIVVLVFFEKKSEALPKGLLDLATERSRTLEEVIVEATKESGMAAELINAQDMYDEEYPPGSSKRAEREKRYLAHVRQRQRMDRIKALPRKAKEKLARALRVHATGQRRATG